jgi:hypothetical protein
MFPPHCPHCWYWMTCDAGKELAFLPVPLHNAEGSPWTAAVWCRLQDQAPSCLARASGAWQAHGMCCEGSLTSWKIHSPYQGTQPQALNCDWSFRQTSTASHLVLPPTWTNHHQLNMHFVPEYLQIYDYYVCIGYFNCHHKEEQVELFKDNTLG